LDLVSRFGFAPRFDHVPFDLPIETGSGLREFGRLAQHPYRSLEQLGLARHQPRGLLEGASGSLQRLRLPSQRRPRFLEKIEDRVDWSDEEARDLPLQPALTLDHVLHQLELTLHRPDQIAGQARAPCRGRRGSEHGIHERSPFAEQVAAAEFRHWASTFSA
jgi:hypothetical protein